MTMVTNSEPKNGAKLVGEEERLDPYRRSRGHQLGSLPPASGVGGRKAEDS